jgi:uncharacterized membrane protein
MDPSMSAVRFEHPELLWLLAIIVPAAILGVRSLRSHDLLRRATILVMRALLLTGVTIVLAGPHFRRSHDQLTVIGVLDISGSVRRFADLPALGTLDPAAREIIVPPQGATEPLGLPENIYSNLDYLRAWFRAAAGVRGPDDRFGLVVFDGRTTAIVPPTRGEYSDENISIAMEEGTNIERAIQLALAMFPAESAKRIVLVSDGNETGGSALQAAQFAAGARDGENSLGPASRLPDQLGAGVPIDVAPISYHIEHDVQVARIEAPLAARPEQVVTIRVVLESVSAANGWLTLFHEEVAVDLNGEESGVQAALALPAGRTVYEIDVPLGRTPVQRFRAVFQTADPLADRLPENNRASAFISTPGRGAILILRQQHEPADRLLQETLRAAGLDVDAEVPGRMPADLLLLQQYDLVILQNVPAYEFDESAQRMLARYVNDFGGGLIMTGGENSFGAGGWNGTPVEDVLPLELDLPREMRINQAALVLVMDKSGSMGMNVAGSRATQQEIANRGAAEAIRSLQRESLIGVVVFDSFSSVRVELAPNDDPEKSAERVMGITPAGGTFMGPALRRAQEMLREADVKRKYVVVLSDGHSEGREELPAIVGEMAAEGISISTIAVGDEADRPMLAAMAEIGGGEFHDVINPALLPRVLVDSVQVVNKPLIKVATVTPVAQASGTTLAAGLADAPPLEGLVLTAPRNDPRVTTELITTENEPLLAHWQAGIGRAAAFTSDVTGDWSRHWAGWPGYSNSFTQLARMISRPPASQDYELATTIDGGTLDIALRAVDEQGDAVDFLSVPGTVYTPDGREIEIKLAQTGPGEYTARVPAEESGNFIVALQPRQGNVALPPVVGGATQAEGLEFRRYSSNIALLQQIAEVTGGRLLDIRDPQSANLYDRAGMRRSVSLLPAWKLLLPFIIAALLLDIAARRIAWDARTIRRAAEAGLARVRPARLKGEESRATLAALRERSDAVFDSMAREAKPGEAATTQRGAHEAPIDEESRQAGIRAALDALQGKRPASAGPRAPKMASPPADSTEVREAAATTSGLLAAKKRLRDQLEGRRDGSS